MSPNADQLEAYILQRLAAQKASIHVNQLVHFYTKTKDGGGVDGTPYGWQVESHKDGAKDDERAIIAGNQTGKTRTFAAEIACHMTGWYPEWWEGYRFDGPNDGVACGTTNQETRDIVQKALIGEIDVDRRPTGTGWIPKSAIGEVTFRQCGVTNVIDTCKVRHVSGGWSEVQFKSYEQRASKFQGVQKDWYWMDEEPEFDDGIFSEIQMRLLVKRGLFFFTRTPLYGETAIVKYFIDGGLGKSYKSIAWRDSPHIDQEMRDRLSERIPSHELETRTSGVPMLGSGAVYNIPDSQIQCEPFPIPPYFRRIVGVDFGIDHPGAGAWIAHDTEADIIYVTDCYRERNWTAMQHAHRIKSGGQWIPTAWPHDGMVRDKGGGETLKDQYQAHGANMLPYSARYNDDKGGGQAREPITMEILERMRTGRFKVFDHQNLWFEEKRRLHRKDGKIVPLNDDIEAATRYAVMDIRFAVSEAESDRPKPSRVTDMDYDPLEEFSIQGSR